MHKILLKNFDLVKFLKKYIKSFNSFGNWVYRLVKFRLLSIRIKYFGLRRHRLHIYFKRNKNFDKPRVHKNFK